MGDEILVLYDTKLKSSPDWPDSGVPLFADLKRKQGRHRWYHDQDHSRWVYEDAENDIFIKVWNHTYVRRNNLLKALESGFYEGLIPAFQGVIRQNNVCRGYVMKRCEEPTDEKRTEVFNNILSTIKKKTEETGLFAYDLHKGNVWMCDGKPCLNDLEGVYPIQEYEKRKKEYKDLKIGKFVKDKGYDSFLKGLL